MIKVTVESKDDGYMKIEVEGHARPAVCASVSTLLQSQIRYLQELQKQFPYDLEVVEK